MPSSICPKAILGGWGSQDYSIKKGYDSLLAQSSLPPHSTCWKCIWSSDGLLKVNILCWTLAHGKILTGENLAKRGFLGPFRCSLYKKYSESINHLFLECSISLLIWKVALQNLFLRVQWPSSYGNIFSKWQHLYNSSFRQKWLFKKVWIALPKYVCWKIWLARNKEFFAEEKTIPSPVANKAICLLSENFKSQFKFLNSSQDLDSNEEVWLKQYNSPTPVFFPPPKPDWQLQLSSKEFSTWKQSQHKYIF